MSEYDQMRRSEELDDDGVLPEELEEEAESRRSEKDRYFAFYDDIKLTPKDDW